MEKMNNNIIILDLFVYFGINVKNWQTQLKDIALCLRPTQISGKLKGKM